MKRLVISALAACGLAATACNPGVYCSDACRYANDGECDDGREGAATGLCERGTDCGDCGTNPDVNLGSELAGPDGSGPPPIEFGSVGPAMDVPGAPGLPTCTCPGPALCSANVQSPEPTGGAGFYRCGGGNGVGLCSLSQVNCPTPSGVDWECRSGEYGVGCYALSNESCEQVGTCGPPEDYGYDLEGVELPAVPIERCVRYGSFLGPADFRNGYQWDVSKCESIFRVGSATTSCGACAQACDAFLSSGSSSGPNPCQQFYDETLGTLDPDPDPDPDPTPVSPSCQAVIDMTVAQYRTLLASSACATTCISRLRDCLVRSNCTDGTCSSAALSCSRSC